MSEAVQIEVVKALPGLILAVTLVGLVIWVRHPLREKVLPRVGNLKIMWFEVTLIQQDVSKSEKVALTQGETTKLSQWHGFDEKAQKQLVERAERIAPVLRGASVLWIDDRPQFNNAERNILSRFGISVDIATSSREALWLVDSTGAISDYDLIISDIDRPEEKDEEGNTIERAGLVLLDELRRGCFRNPVIFYVGQVRPGTPTGAFGICAQAGDLFRLTFDALERTRARCPLPGLQDN